MLRNLRLQLSIYGKVTMACTRTTDGDCTHPGPIWRGQLGEQTMCSGGTWLTYVERPARQLANKGIPST